MLKWAGNKKSMVKLFLENRGEWKVDNRAAVYISAEHLVFSRLVRQPKSPNFRTVVLSFLLYLGLIY